jgi:hypothetical protein
MRHLRSLVLFATLVALVGVTALALDVPHEFVPNELISATQMNANFEAVEAAVTTLEAQVAALGAVDVAALAAAVTALEVKVGQLEATVGRIEATGPVVAYVAASGSPTRLDLRVPKTVASVSIDAPSEGYVFVSANFHVDAAHFTSIQTNVRVELKDDEGPVFFAGPYVTQVQLPPELPTTIEYRYSIPVSMSRVFEVPSAGPRTYYLVAVLVAGGAFDTELGYPSLEAVFLPAAH